MCIRDRRNRQKACSGRAGSRSNWTTAATGASNIQRGALRGVAPPVSRPPRARPRAGRATARAPPTPRRRTRSSPRSALERRATRPAMRPCRSARVRRLRVGWRTGRRRQTERYWLRIGRDSTSMRVGSFFLAPRGPFRCGSAAEIGAVCRCIFAASIAADSTKAARSIYGRTKEDPRGRRPVVGSLRASGARRQLCAHAEHRGGGCQARRRAC